MTDDEQKHRICCIECSLEMWEEDSPVFLAMFGPQGLEGEPAILVCPEWDDDNLLVRIGLASKFVCDGCGCFVSVAPSSKWFIEEHRKERSA